MPVALTCSDARRARMTVCNACRYCEQYCPVFPAMERRLTFDAGDLVYLANLCHNCGECLYACQYAPPHEFGINVPADARRDARASYEDTAGRGRWRGVPAAGPARRSAAGRRFQRACSWRRPRWLNRDALTAPRNGAVFYAVMPHGVMVGTFGLVGLFVLVRSVIGLRRLGKPSRDRSLHRSRWRRSSVPSATRRPCGICTRRDPIASRARSAQAVAPVVSSRHVRRVPAVLRLDIGGGDLSLVVRMGGALRLQQRAGGARHGGRARPAARPDRAVVARSWPRSRRWAIRRSGEWTRRCCCSCG